MSDFVIQSNVSLAEYTSFKSGGEAEYFGLAKNSSELLEALKCTLPSTPLWIIGYGSNTLISDKGLPGMSLCIKGGTILVEGEEIIADAGAWWDDVVVAAISAGLWGIEFMSEIPGSVGGSAFINITAYGQSLGPVVSWIEVWDRESSSIKKLRGNKLEWGYKSSVFQTQKGKNWIILRVGLSLSKQKKDELVYQKATDIAEELDLDAGTLEGRRKIIIEARKRAGSLWQPNNDNGRTAGSFFRNPFVSREQLDELLQHEEHGVSPEQIKKMNQVHGGDTTRVSAAHVLLAAGFKRGQTWGKVKLNDQNLLKIEALEGASSQDIYNVMSTIQQTVSKKLGISLEPEVRLLGDFS